MTRSLRHHPDFRRFWFGQTVSQIGSAASFVALPLVAVLTLRAGPVAMGLLTAAERLPPLIVGPLIGPMVDRLDRRRLMLAADAGRAVLLAWIPIAVALGTLAFWHMILIAFGVGALSMQFDVASRAFLPTVIPAERLADGNAKLSASQSVGEVTGPGIAAGLIAVAGASIAVLADAVSYAVSFAAVARMRTRDTARSPQLSGAVSGGFRLLWRDPVLRSVAMSNTVLAFFAQLQAAVYFLFLVRTLHLTASMIGVMFTLAGLVGFGAAAACDRLVNRFGLIRLLVGGQVVLVAGGVLLAAASGPRFTAAAFIIAGEACFSVGMTLFGVGYTTLFQLRTADAVRGRVIGAARIAGAALIPVAAVIAGVVADVTSVRTVLVVGAVGMAGGLIAVLRPAVRATVPVGQADPAAVRAAV